MAWQDALDEAARAISDRSHAPLSMEPNWQPLPAGERPPATIAVDGSHAVLVDNGAMWVVAVRAAAISWPQVPQEVPIDIHAVAPDEAEAYVALRYEAHGLGAPRVGHAESLAEQLRALREWEVTRTAMDDLPKGSLILVDGALERLPKQAAELVDRLLEAAAHHGLDMVGVAKRSRLDAGGVPLVQALTRLAREAGRTGTWRVAVPGHQMAQVARLHAAAPHAFRVDATSLRAMGALIPLCRDAVYTGYPYPLAVAHNAVAISHTETRRLHARLQDAVRREGGAAAAAWIEDFHAVLDTNAPRL